MLGVLLEAAAAEVGAGVLGRVVHRGLDQIVVEQPLDPAEGDQLVVQPLLRADVGVADDNARTIQVCQERMGGVDVLINNAGYA